MNSYKRISHVEGDFGNDAEIEGGVLKSVQMGLGLTDTGIGRKEVSFSRKILTEIKELISMGWPLGKFILASCIVLTFMMHASFSVISIYYVGHLGSTDFVAAAALSTSIFNITGVSVIYGIAGALDTFVSQQFGHLRKEFEAKNGSFVASTTLAEITSSSKYAKKSKLLGTHLHRSLLILWITIIPIALLWIFISPVLSFFKQPQILVELTSFYLKRMIFVLPCLATYEALKRYWTSLERGDGPLLWMTIGALTVWITHSTFVTKGWHYAPYCLASGYISALISALIQTLCTKSIRLTLNSPSLECLNDWKKYLKIGVPATLMICAEWWAFEICSLVAGSLGSVSMVSHSIVQTTTYSAYMLPYGLTGVVAVRIGQNLGAGDAGGAKVSAVASVCLIAGFMFINAVFLFVMRGEITGWYISKNSSALPGTYNPDSSNSNSTTFGTITGTETTEYEQVNNLVSLLFIIASTFQIFDGAQNCCQAILRGTGRVTVGAILTLASYYTICLPIGIPLAFYGPSIAKEKGMGVIGLWIGIACATIFLGVTLTVFVSNINWEFECGNARERVHDDSEVSLKEYDDEMYDVELMSLNNT